MVVMIVHKQVNHPLHNASISLRQTEFYSRYFQQISLKIAAVRRFFTFFPDQAGIRVLNWTEAITISEFREYIQLINFWIRADAFVSDKYPTDIGFWHDNCII